MQKVNVLLPMKGHSERVPNKNLKLFNGFPLYHAVLKEILNSKFVDNVYVNTDSKEIMNDINRNFPSIIIVPRPEEIRGDHVSMNRIIKYDLEQIKGEYFLQTHSTNPLLTTETLDNAIQCFYSKKEKHDSLFSVTKWQTRLYWQDVTPINHNPKELIRTQDLMPVYEENSNFYIFTRQSFNEAGEKRIGLRPMMFEVNKIESLDIDEPEDFLMAEQIYKTGFN